MSLYDRVLVTGGGGMLAAALVRSCDEREHPPTVLNRAALDVTDLAAVQAMFNQFSPTLVLNCAAFTKVDLCEEQRELAMTVNGIGAGIVAAAAARVGAVMVHYSTDFVFDGTAHHPYRVTDPIHPLSVYGQSKAAGEQAIQEVGEQSLIIRTAWLYGPGGPCFPQTMINAARAGKPLKVVDDQIGSPTFTRDLAGATFDLLDAGARGIFHVVNSGQTSWHDFTAAILEEFDLKTDLTKTTSTDWKKLRPNSAARPAYSVLDNADYTQATGKTMRPWREALRAYRHEA